MTAKDGTELHSWMLWPRGWTKQQRRSRPTVLFFQACMLESMHAIFTCYMHAIML